jgi:hypothetical protein
LAIAPYEGKGTGETSLFRRMYDRVVSNLKRNRGSKE